MQSPHNYKIGPIRVCQICNTNKIQKVMDFGYQPLADDLISFKDQSRKTIFYPLEVFLCARCTILQTGYIVGDKTLYSKNYPSDEPRRRCPSMIKFSNEFKYRAKIKLDHGLEYFKEFALREY